jgi:transposase-like protein
MRSPTHEANSHVKQGGLSCPKERPPIRKRFDVQFKSTAAFEAFKEEQTLKELAEKYQVHLNQISVWKKKLLEDAAALFEHKNKKDGEHNNLNLEKQELIRQVGEIRYENEWLKKVQATLQQKSGLIDCKEPRLSVRKQCLLIGVSKSLLYYQRKPR